MRIIALFNQKGGVGKTTTTANLGAALAEAGRSVTLVDLDPQANLSAHFGVDPENPGITTYRVLTDGVALKDSLRVVQKGGEGRGKIQIAPADTDLAAAEVELVSVVGRETLLRKMADLKKFESDYVLIDCPPSLGLLSLNALVYATEVLIPLQAHFLALQGMEKLFDTVAMVRQGLNPKLHVSGILFTQFEQAAKLTGEVTGEVDRFIADARGKNHPVSNAIVFQTTIRRNVKLAEAPSFGQSIFDYAPSSAGAADYSVLAEEVMKMEPAQPKAAASAPKVEAKKAVAVPAPAAAVEPKKPVVAAAAKVAPVEVKKLAQPEPAKPELKKIDKPVTPTPAAPAAKVEVKKTVHVEPVKVEAKKPEEKKPVITTKPVAPVVKTPEVQATGAPKV